MRVLIEHESLCEDWRVSEEDGKSCVDARFVGRVKSSWIPRRESCFSCDTSAWEGVSTATVFHVGEWHSPWSESSRLERSSLWSQRSLESSYGQVVLLRKPDASCGSLRFRRGTCVPAIPVTFVIARGLDSAVCILFLRSCSWFRVPGPWPSDWLDKNIPVWVLRFRPSVLII